jgi:hypothetical protein
MSERIYKIEFTRPTDSLVLDRQYTARKLWMTANAVEFNDIATGIHVRLPARSVRVLCGGKVIEFPKDGAVTISADDD